MFWRRRRPPRRDGLTADERALVARRTGLWPQLETDERQALESVAAWLVDTKRWEASRGFTLTPDMPVTIAAHAALLVLGLEIRLGQARDHYRTVSAIVVHPTTVTLHGERAGPAPGTVAEGPFPIAGQASDERGPILLAWDAVLQDGRHPERGVNVVHHEFAHKIDLLDGYADGTPPLGGRVDPARWEAVNAAVHAAVAEAPHPVLRSYAARNRAELFAVASEAFLNRPVDLRAHEPELYGLLTELYLQDPAARAQDATPSTPTPSPRR